MTVFVDTSVLLTLVNANDDRNPQVTAAWFHLIDQHESLVTSNYVLVETIALLGRRFGLETIRRFQNDVVPILRSVWVTEALHQRAMSVLLTAGLRHLSLVDCLSFEIMRDLKIDTALAMDAHFQRQGFTCLP